MAFVLVIAACTAGSTTASLAGTGSEPGSASSSTAPTDPAGPAPKSGALGAACTDYVACCKLLADTAPQLSASCDAFKTQFDKATASGISADSFEASCQSSVDTLKSAGYCKPAVKAQKCVPSCTTDADCANSCPAIAGGTQCCDTTTSTCFGSKTSSCPKPEDAGVDPPPSY